MRRLVVFAVVFSLVELAGGGVSWGDDGTADEPRDAHKALREAVEDIRAQYSKPGAVYWEFGEHADLRRPGLGIIIRGGFSWPGQKQPGAEILGVTPGSPADEAGLQSGDVVTTWNGEVLTGSSSDPHEAAATASRELVERSKKLEEGESVSLGYLRDGESREATLVAREVDFSPRLAGGWRRGSDFEFHSAPVLAGQTAEPWFLPRGWLDMEMVSVNPDLGEYFGSDTGVLVVRGPEGEETLGLESGDVILEIGGREVKSPEHAMRILRSYEPDEELSILIIRHKRTQTLTGTAPETSFHFDYRFKWSGDED